MSEGLTPEEEKQFGELTNAVASELAEGKKPDVVVNELVKRGWPKEDAGAFVQKVARALAEYRQAPEARQMLASRYARHMLYGALWAIGGTVVTVWTYTAAASGGTYVVAWGAIAFGIFDFFRGLFGWLRYQSQKETLEEARYIHRSHSKPTDDHALVDPEAVVCKKCGTENSNVSPRCSYCNEKL